MKTLVPAYYTKFHCIADRCRHNCCIGWEIDIDEQTYSRYCQTEGAFGDRLRAGIDAVSDSASPCFRLTAGDRCTFLNENGLCDIITVLGEGALCEICALHPRYRNFFGDRIEMGLGLCCEEVCRILLHEREPVHMIVLSDDGKQDLPLEEELDFYAVRERMLAILQDRTYTYDERAARLSAFCGLHSDSRAPSDWAEIYRSLERLDSAWDTCLDRLSAIGTWRTDGGLDTVWEQLAVYFLMRYASQSLDDGLLAPRVAFALHAVSMIRTLGKEMSMDELCELCRMYSCEIEYSEENVAELMERVTV